jgi:putative oxidoreductase
MLNSKINNGILLAGRLLLAWIFLHESVDLAAHFDGASSAMSKMGVPIPALMATIALQFFAGIAVATGYYARVGAAALGLFCLATAIGFHMNFAVRNELLHFEKDLAIAGGMFILLVQGAGQWSIDSVFRARSAA